MGVRFRQWIPLAKISPLETFFYRTIVKNRRLLSLLLAPAKYTFKLTGCDFLYKRPNGNIVLTLRRDCSLGESNSQLELPEDEEIYRAVKMTSEWDPETCRFLSSGIITLNQLGYSKILFLDLGANVGLVTLQVLRMSRVPCTVMAFEPIKRHLEALNRNLKSISISNDVQIYGFALGKENRNASIFTSEKNFGASSTIRSAIHAEQVISEEIRVVNTHEFFSQNFEEYEAIVIKSDTEGMDATVLGNLPRTIWDKTHFVALEVMSGAGVDKNDVQKLLPRIESFEHTTWDAQGKIRTSIDEIYNYWVSPEISVRNLYLSKTTILGK